MKFNASTLVCSLLLLGASALPVEEANTNDLNVFLKGGKGGRPGGGSTGGPSKGGNSGGSGGSSGGSGRPTVKPGNGGKLGNVSTGFGKGGNGQVTGVGKSSSKIEGVDLFINGISTALDIVNLGITAAQLQQSGELRSCIANMPACCREIQAGVVDPNFFFCKQAGVGKVLAGRVGGCAFTGSADEAYVTQGATACAAAFPLGSSS